MTQSTATAEGTEHDSSGAVGRITRIIGPVVDVEFPRGEVPDLFNALTFDLGLNGEDHEADPRGRPAPR